MREIKFRFWNREMKQMQYPFESGYFELKPEGLKLDEKLFYIKTYEDRCDVMQFTGLLDKQGVEIYEGDIIDNMTVVYEAPTFWLAKDENSLHELSYKDGIHKVIGNIYENPNLL